MIHSFRVVERQRAGRSSRAFTHAFGEDPTRPTWIGLEHEFLVFDADRRRIDFRRVIHQLGLGRPDLEPRDRNAYRLPTGSIVTADGTEAEIATPPIELGPRFTDRLDGWAAYEREALRRRVGELSLVGDSTHLNVTVPGDVDAEHVADLFAARFSPGMMLLMDRATSPGLLVRPRPFRLELGGEYVTGRALRAAAAYAVGATLACVDALRGRRTRLPPEVDVRLERGVLRYGWYVDRAAFGVDLYAGGRAASLLTVGESRTSAGDQLIRSWEVARQQVEAAAAHRDLVVADDIVAGRAPLPLERRLGDEETDVEPPRRPRSGFGAAVRPWHRSGFELAPVMLTWQAAVFLVVRRDRERGAFAAVPGHRLAAFLERLRSGALDGPVESYLACAPSGRRLDSPAQASVPGLYDELGLRAALLAPERDHRGRPIRPRIPRHRLAARTRLAAA